MWAQYDENLQENLFFKDITSNHKDILKKASEESWIICIPRTGTFEQTQIDFDMVLDHILIPYEKKQFSTLSKRHLTVENKQIKTGNCQLFPNSVEILFEEVFYSGTNKFTVLCIDQPLFLERSFCESHHKLILENLNDCVDFLWVESLGHEILDHIKRLAENFLYQHEEFEAQPLQTQKDLIGALYSQCLQVALKNHHINEKCNKAASFLDNLKIAVETYMQLCLGKTLMISVNSLLCHSDSHFNFILRNSTEVQLSDLNIDPKLSDVVISAKCELSKLNNYYTVLDKINCLKNTFDAFFQYREESVTTDDVLQILVFIIIKLSLNNWIANLIYMKEFRLSLLTISDQNSYYLTSLEAAIEFIKSNHFLNIRNKLYSPKDKSSQIEYIFNKIKSEDLEKVKWRFSQNQDQRFQSNLCHPLCSCENCEQILKMEKRSENFTIEAINDKGQNLLIYSALQGHCELVDFFIQEGIGINSTDFTNRSALHYAASRGFQDVLLLLVNYKADVNLRDNEKNTPLHLACSFGHVNCVKALLYSSPELEVNQTNFYGETALHLAVKWNFIEIVKLLLENNAYTNIKSRRNFIPLNLSTNYFVSKMLRQFSNEQNNNFIESYKQESVVLKEERKVDCKDFGIRPKTLDQFKKIDLLLKAIENNDLPLTCFHLGFNSEQRDNSDLGSRCHPLCNCSKCSFEQGFNQSFVRKPSEGFNVNMCNAEGLTPLHMAAKFGRTEVLRLLLDSGALPNLKCYKSLYTPLHLACIFQRIQVVRELLNCGDCRLNEQDSKGNTPLYYACMKNDKRIVDALLSRDADCNVKNLSGKTILQEVEEKMHYGIFKLLRESSQNSSNCDDCDF